MSCYSAMLVARREQPSSGVRSLRRAVAAARYSLHSSHMRPEEALKLGRRHRALSRRRHVHLDSSWLILMTRESCACTHVLSKFLADLGPPPTSSRLLRPIWREEQRPDVSPATPRFLTSLLHRSTCTASAARVVSSGCRRAPRYRTCPFWSL